jgi:hypothetical protein
MKPRKPVAIGWGSLIWRPENFPALGIWQQDGPALPIEFTRQSSNGSITLVVAPGAPAVPTLWTELGVITLDEAKDALRRREKTSEGNVAYWSPARWSQHEEAKVIGEWAKAKGIEAVVWTALRPKFDGENGRFPTEDEVIAYLKTRDTSVRERAREYIERAPEQVRTPYRTAIERELGWKARPNGSMIAGPLEIDSNAWGFDAIRGADAARGDMLEHAGPPEALISALTHALDQAQRNGAIRLVIDSKRESFESFRAMTQFTVHRDLYDWFYNARTGYRAAFWRDPMIGIEFNHRIVAALAGILAERLSDDVTVRAIQIIETNDTSREDRDRGRKLVQRDSFIRSLDPSVAKVWICERLHRNEGGRIDDIGLPVFREARDGPKLIVPRWASAVISQGDDPGFGLLAPRPSEEYCWLDFKGGVIAKSGELVQPKPNDLRALQLHNIGWTWPVKKKA